MIEAIIVFSRKGFFNKKILAREIHSREHARKLWPLVTSDGYKHLVTWVKPSFKEGKLIRKSHFRILTGKKKLKQFIRNEEVKRQLLNNESEEHKLAKELLKKELERRIEKQIGLQWWFKDQDISDFPLSGNLLLSAKKIQVEYILKTAFDINFRLDLAVLGSPIHKEPMILGGIEIEMSHNFDGRKALLCKSLGFPLISIDISNMHIKDLTPKWAETILSKTRYDSNNNLRKNYIYIHDLLYPLFIQLPQFINRERRHQYLIFSSDKSLEQIKKWLKILADKLGYSDKEVVVSIVNGKSKQAMTAVNNARDIVGKGWEQFNTDKFLRLTLPCPENILDMKAYYLHMAIPRILLTKTETLIGYQYRNNAYNRDISEDIWFANERPPTEKEFKTFKVLPKRLSEPLTNYLNFIENHDK